MRTDADGGADIAQRTPDRTAQRRRYAVVEHGGNRPEGGRIVDRSRLRRRRAEESAADEVHRDELFSHLPAQHLMIRGAGNEQLEMRGA